MCPLHNPGLRGDVDRILPPTSPTSCFTLPTSVAHHHTRWARFGTMRPTLRNASNVGLPPAEYVTGREWVLALWILVGGVGGLVCGSARALPTSPLLGLALNHPTYAGWAAAGTNPPSGLPGGRTLLSLLGGSLLHCPQTGHSLLPLRALAPNRGTGRPIRVVIRINPHTGCWLELPLPGRGVTILSRSPADGPALFTFPRRRSLAAPAIEPPSSPLLTSSPLGSNPHPK